MKITLKKPFFVMAGCLFTLLLSLPTSSLAIENGQDAPDFTLPNPLGDRVSLSSFKDKKVVLEWMNPGCPFVKKHYKNGDMQALQKKYREQGVVWLVINSTNPNHQDHLSPDDAKKVAEEWKIDPAFMLFDSAGIVGKQYGAKTTPHMFVVDNGKVVYQGAVDDDSDVFSEPSKAVNYVTTSLEAIAKGEKISTAQTSPYGCSVKYQ
jgi:peroxiredoxin